VSRDLTALVELGSNSVRLMLVRIEPGVGYRVLRDERVQTRLGAGADAMLPAESVMCTVEAVRQFFRALPAPAGRALGVATAAVRDAPNAAALLGRLRLEVGVDVEVLTADEEARLGALAARASLQLIDATVVDVGGRSLQVSAIRDREPVPIASVPLGTLRTTQRFLAQDPPAPEELDALREAVRKAVAGLVPVARAGESLVGVGGTARALGRLGGGAGASRDTSQRVRIRLEDLEAICGRLAVVGLAERRQLPGLKPDRADVIVAGAVVFDEIVRRGGYTGLLVAEHGVRHGVLLRETFERARV
jgi:exopolyphosphatase/guanosine-5'-triphosphate,3'-diphosphate pyrophosphatase